MNYRLLNEVLIEWNESPKEDSDSVFLKSEDIKESLDRCFIYKLNEKYQIKIFDIHWPEYEKYKDKVWINGKHWKLNHCAWTNMQFTPGEYKVYIKDIDKVTDMTYMFSECTQLVSAFIPNSVTTIGRDAFSCCYSLPSITIPNSVTEIRSSAFYHCWNLKTVYVEDINKFNQIKFEEILSNPTCYGAKLIELKK